MVMTSVIYDDMLITGRSLDGKMSFKFTAKNTITTEISQEKPANLMAFVKENIFDVMDNALQDLTNNEEIWADISEIMMFTENGLKVAAYTGEISTNTKVRQRFTKLDYEETTDDFIHLKFSSKYQDYRRPYREYEYDAQVHYHFSSNGQPDGKISYQLELTTDGETTVWK